MRMGPLRMKKYRVCELCVISLFAFFFMQRNVCFADIITVPAGFDADGFAAEIFNYAGLLLPIVLVAGAAALLIRFLKGATKVL
jgi:hypothetical protein